MPKLQLKSKNLMTITHIKFRQMTPFFRLILSYLRQKVNINVYVVPHVNHFDL